MENESAPVAEKSETTASMRKKFAFQLNTKTILLGILFLLVIAALYTYKGVFVAATVDGSLVSRLSVVEELEKRSGKQVLDTLITKRLIQDEVTRQNIQVAPAVIDEEIEKIKTQIGQQGGTLEAALAQQKMTEGELRDQILIQKELEQVLKDKIVVTDDEVQEYIAQNKVTSPTGASTADFINQIREQLKNQKFGTEADKWVADIKAAAKIQYFVDYGKPLPEPVAPTGTPTSE